MRLARRHWWAAFSIAALLHGTAFWLGLRETPPAGFGGANLGPIGVALGPSGGGAAPAAPDVPEVPPQEQVEALDAVEPIEPLDAELSSPVEPTPIDAAEAPTEPVVETLEPETPPEAELVPDPVTAAAIDQRDVTAASPPRRRPTDVVPPPEPRREPIEASPPAPTPSPPDEQVAEASATSTDDPSPSAAADQAAVGAASGGVPGAREDYLAALAAWLERHKEYPTRARRRGQEGTILLQVRIAPDGDVLAHSIAESSGHELLDRAVLAMLERAKPLPPMPSTMQQAALEILVPVNFQLR